MLEMLRRAGFSEEEYSLLRKALENSKRWSSLKNRHSRQWKGSRTTERAILR